MGKDLIAVIAAFLCSIALGGVVEQGALSDIITILEDRKCLKDSRTFQALTEMEKHASGKTLALCRLAHATLAYEKFDKTLDMESLKACQRLCAEIKSRSDITNRSWTRGAAALVLATTLAHDGQYKQSYSICVDALRDFDMQPCCRDCQLFWEAFCKRHLSMVLTLEQSLRLYAAMALLMDNPKADVSKFTDNMPKEAMERIQILSSLLQRQ